MSSEDREQWDHRYSALEPKAPGVPQLFSAHEGAFPTSGTALELACGQGEASIWMALRGLEVTGLDVSPMAISAATDLAKQHGVAQRCHFEVFDLDAGLPDGPTLDVALCHLFRQPDLDQPLLDRLRPGGLLAVAALSEVGAKPGRFRAKPGELTRAFLPLELISSGESEGRAWLLGTKRR